MLIGHKFIVQNTPRGAPILFCLHIFYFILRARQCTVLSTLIYYHHIITQNVSAWSPALLTEGVHSSVSEPLRSIRLLVPSLASALFRFWSRTIKPSLAALYELEGTSCSLKSGTQVGKSSRIPFAFSREPDSK